MCYLFVCLSTAFFFLSYMVKYSEQGVGAGSLDIKFTVFPEINIMVDMEYIYTDSKCLEILTSEENVNFF